MSFERIGRIGVEHVAQPEGSDYCFAACMASVTGNSIEASHNALVSGGLSEEDGTTTAPWRQTTIEARSSTVTIEPVFSPVEQPDNVEEVLDAIDGLVQEGKTMAILYKKNTNPGDYQYHWSLLVPRTDLNSEQPPVEIMDPLEQRMRSLEPYELIDKVERSMEHQGVCLYAIGEDRH